MNCLSKGLCVKVFPLLLGMLITISCKQQQFMPQTAPQKVDLVVENQVCHFELLDSKENHKPDADKTYHWFNHGKLQSNQGAFQGKLLHGAFSITDQEGRLIENGYYQVGIKDGKWQKWFTSGQLAEIYHWKEGVLEGDFTEFDIKCNIIKKGNYKSGKLNGDFLQMNDSGQLDTLSYKSGQVIERKAKKGDNRIKGMRDSNSVAIDSLNHH